MIEITRDAAKPLIAEAQKEHPRGNRIAYIGMTQCEEYDVAEGVYVRVGCFDNTWWKYFLVTEADKIIESTAPTPHSIHGGRASDYAQYESDKLRATARAFRYYGERMAARYEAKADQRAAEAVEIRERGERIRS
jgi:hypothetical protein